MTEHEHQSALLTFGSLFAGIGGFDLGLEWAGMICKWQVEKDEFCQKVLAKHWPDVPKFGDIRDVGKHNLQPVGLICGGFPCQPFSVAGKRGGTEDDRYLWPEMLRVVKELKPRYVIGENVSGIVPLALDEVLSSLENIGYACETFIIPAAGVDAPHRRDRVWIVAYRNQSGLAQWKSQRGNARTQQQAVKRNGGFGANATQQYVNGTGQAGTRRRRQLTNRREWLPEPGVGRVADGVPRRVDRLRALGNAVVPQLAQVIGEIVIEHYATSCNLGEPEAT